MGGFNESKTRIDFFHSVPIDSLTKRAVKPERLMSSEYDDVLDAFKASGEDCWKVKPEDRVSLRCCVIC